jgi:hypothetical protein
MRTTSWSYHLDSIHWALAVDAAGEVAICLGTDDVGDPRNLRLDAEECRALWGAFDSPEARTLIAHDDGWLVAVVNAEPFGLRWIGVKAPGGQSMVLAEQEWRSACAEATREIERATYNGVISGLGDGVRLLGLRDRS